MVTVKRAILIICILVSLSWAGWRTSVYIHWWKWEGHFIFNDKSFLIKSGVDNEPKLFLDFEGDFGDYLTHWSTNSGYSMTEDPSLLGETWSEDVLFYPPEDLGLDNSYLVTLQIVAKGKMMGYMMLATWSECDPYGQTCSREHVVYRQSGKASNSPSQRYGEINASPQAVGRTNFDWNFQLSFTVRPTNPSFKNLKQYRKQ